MRAVHQEFSRFRSVGKAGCNSVEKRPVGARWHKIRYRVTGMVCCSAIDWISKSFGCITGVDPGKGRHRCEIGLVNWRGMTVHVVGGAEQSVEFTTLGINIVPRDDGRLCFTIKNRLNILGLQIACQTLVFSLCVTHRHECKEHAHHQEKCARTSVSFSR